jgi:hypothetical protein
MLQDDRYGEAVDLVQVCVYAGIQEMLDTGLAEAALPRDVMAHSNASMWRPRTPR